MSRLKQRLDITAILMLILTVVVGYAVWQNQTMYGDIKADTKDIKIAFREHGKEQEVCEKQIESRLSKLEVLTCGRAEAAELKKVVKE